MKITTAAFLQLSEHAQRELILDGILRLKSEIFRLTTDFTKLNGWMATMDLATAEDDVVQRYLKLKVQMEENIDALTEQILIAGQKNRHLTEQINRRAKTSKQ